MISHPRWTTEATGGRIPILKGSGSPGVLAIYSDGSFDGIMSSFSCVVEDIVSFAGPVVTDSQSSLCRGLQHSSYSGELTGVISALEFALDHCAQIQEQRKKISSQNQPGLKFQWPFLRIEIFTDCQQLVHVVHGHSSTRNLAQGKMAMVIRNMVGRINRDHRPLRLTWTPAHLEGDPGNGLADLLAKRACCGRRFFSSSSLPPSMALTNHNLDLQIYREHPPLLLDISAQRLANALALFFTSSSSADQNRAYVEIGMAVVPVVSILPRRSELDAFAVEVMRSLNRAAVSLNVSIDGRRFDMAAPTILEGDDNSSIEVDMVQYQ
jgi:ribonuclease HI